MMKAGIVGAGYIGEIHALAYRTLPNIKLSLIVDQNLASAQRLAQRFQTDAASDLDGLLSSDVDVVSLCTPTPNHMETAIALLRAGKHVLCEKPIARNLEQAQLIMDTANKLPAKFMVAHVSRYEADHLKAKEILERGEIGPLRMAFHSITSPFPGWSMNNWLGDKTKSGGPIVDLAIHGVDYLLWLFKSPVVRVFARGSQDVLGNNHYALATLQFENGGLGLIETSWAHPPSYQLSCKVELCGTDGRIAWDYNQIDPMQTLIEGQGKQSYIMEGENSYAAEIADFIRCIENDLPSPIPGQEAKNALQVCLAALESLETGRCIEIDPV